MYASRGFDFHIAFYIQNLIYVIYVCLHIVVSNQFLWTVHVRLPLW